MDIDIKFNQAGINKLIEDSQGIFSVMAENIKEEAKNLVPVKTGALRDSIEVFKNTPIDEKYIGSTLPYAIFVELGTRNTPPNPYLRPALDNTIKRII